MTYEYHTEDQCDKCDNEVGKKNLFPVPFIYMDMNDKSHKDLGQGYRRYYVCKKCLKREDKNE